MDLAPEWLRTPLLAALLAALGYVAKLLIEEFTKWRLRRDERQSKLVALQSLLLASRRVYEIQNDLIRKLHGEILLSGTGKQLGETASYDEFLATAYPEMEERHKRMHGLIRAYTTTAVRPLNLAILDWLNADTYFKGQSRPGSGDDLASNLQTLEAHLVLWKAKYDFWIPDHPERAFVYMADENEHGVGFPVGIEKIIAKRTGGPFKPTFGQLETST
jgi:hypothetical protein